MERPRGGSTVSAPLATYRKNHPLVQKLPQGGLVGGQVRQLVYFDEVSGRDMLFTAHCFSLKETATALGRTLLTFRKWLRDSLVPEPIFTDPVRGYRYYAVDEVSAIAEALAVHERSFTYFAVGHVTTVALLRWRLEAARSALITHV